ncbi:hypothetical protein E4T56_gene10157 [Termitomyces sp. T112]|nr:hypothetical protein E4T56_gene10157 [Termitomyces sp. T112]
MVAIQLRNSREAEERRECVKLNCSVVDNVFARHVARGHCGCNRNCGGHRVSYDRTPNPYAQIPQQAQQVIEDILTAVKDYVPPAQYTPEVMTPAPAVRVVDLSLMLAPTAPSTPVALTPNPPVSGAASSAINDLFDGELEEFLDTDLDAPGELEDDTVALSESEEVQQVRRGRGRKKAK